jgi:hypothetical protein
MLLQLPQPWSPAQATERIRAISLDEDFIISLTGHARGQIAKRDLISGDVHYLLENGFVHRQADPSTNPNFYKYQIEGDTPNSESRKVRAVVIPDWQSKEIKIVTVMWVDES